MSSTGAQSGILQQLSLICDWDHIYIHTPIYHQYTSMYAYTCEYIHTFLHIKIKLNIKGSCLVYMHDQIIFYFFILHFKSSWAKLYIQFSLQNKLWRKCCNPFPDQEKKHCHPDTLPVTISKSHLFLPPAARCYSGNYCHSVLYSFNGYVFGKNVI